MVRQNARHASRLNKSPERAAAKKRGFLGLEQRQITGAPVRSPAHGLFQLLDSFDRSPIDHAG
jgi:hypothetical protein